MSKTNRFSSFIFSVLVVFSMLPFPRAARAQDKARSGSAEGAASVFVFRESSRKPQSGGLGGSASFVGESQGRAGRSNATIAALAQKRRAAAIAERKEIAIAAANKKLVLSKTLTAKAENFLDRDQTDSAITNFRNALVQNPKNLRAADGLSNALTAKGIEVAGDTNNEAALTYFDEAVKFDKKNDVAYAKAGAIYDAKGQKDKAVVNYEKAIAINPDYKVLYAPLGIDYIGTGEIAKAESWMQKADAAGVDNVDSRFLHGLVGFKQNKNPEALAAFEKALQMDGRFAEAQYYRGQTLARMGQQDQAIAAYKTTLELAPSFAPASFDLGVVNYNSGKFNDAALAYQEAVKNDNKNWQAHFNLASTYRQMEKYPEANAEYKLAETGIKNADLYSEWGFCLGKVNEWENSVAKLQKAKELSPAAVDNSNVGWGYYNAGYSQTQAKNNDEAAKNYAMAKTSLQTAVQQDPKLDAAYLNLGSTHNALGEFDVAVGILKTALGLHSDWGIATNQLGLGYRGLGDLVNAVASFKQVVNLDGNNLNGLFNLGEAYNASGNKKEAKKVNDKLRKLNPSMAAALDNILSGKAVVDAAKQKIEQKIKVPKLPF